MFRRVSLNFAACLMAASLALMPGAKTLRAAATAPTTTSAPAADFVGTDTVPPGFEGATVDVKPDARVPLDLAFTDENGRRVVLRDLLAAGRPVILTPVYYTCPNLCNITLNNLVAALKPLPMTMGKDYDVISISINPRETSDLAAAKKRNYVQSLGIAAAVEHWHFLTSPDDQVRKLCAAIGFGYKFDPQSGQYLHQAAIYIVMPDGRVSRTIPGAYYETELLQDSLTYASQGKVGSPLFRAAVSCGLISFDPATGRYRHNPWMWAGTVGGATILLSFILFMTMLWRYTPKRHTEVSPPAT